MLKAVIFDLDGTVLDTLRDLHTATNLALAQNGLPPRTLDEVRLFVGNGIRLLVERAVPAGTPETVVDRVFRDFNACYAQHCADETKPYRGIPVALRALRNAGFGVAVVSNKSDYAVQTLVRTYFPGLFHFALGFTDGMRKKPAPDMVLAALSHLGATAEEAVYVGDSDVDIATAKAAGMPCISVTWGFRDRAFLRRHGASVFADDPREMLRQVELLHGADPRDS